MLRTPEPPPGYRRNVGILLIAPDRRVFAGRRGDLQPHAWAHAWQLPQGGVDKGEEPHEAALRELREETGTDRAEILRGTQDWMSYDVPSEISDRLWKGKWRGQAQRWFAMRFTGADSDIDIATEHPEFAAWRWAPMAEIVAGIVPFKRAVYEAVAAEFADLLA